MLLVVFKNIIDFNGRIIFEREQFKDILIESIVLVFEVIIEEVQVGLSYIFVGFDGYEF